MEQKAACEKFEREHAVFDATCEAERVAEREKYEREAVLLRLQHEIAQANASQSQTVRLDRGNNLAYFDVAKQIKLVPAFIGKDVEAFFRSF